MSETAKIVIIILLTTNSVTSSQAVNYSTGRIKRSMNLRVSPFNANSLLGHIDLVTTYFATHFFHIISVCETWLYSTIKDNLVVLDNCFIMRNDREGKMGGGVACYIHKSLKVKLLAASPSLFKNSPEFINLEVNPPDAESLLFCSVYRRPKGLLFDDFLVAYCTYSHAYKSIIFSGDVNCNLLTEHFESRYFRDFIYSLSLHLVDSGPTHHTATSDSWLDVMVIDSEHKLISYSKSDTPFIAEHDLLKVEYAFDLKTPDIRKVTRRCYAKLNEAAFLEKIPAELCALGNFHRGNEGFTSNFDDAVESFPDIYKLALDTHAPSRNFCISRSAESWFTEELREHIRERGRLFKRACRANSALGYAIFRNYKDKLTADLRNARCAYQLNTPSAVREPKQLWGELRSLGLVKPDLPSPLHFFSAEELNQYYVSISSMNVSRAYDATSYSGSITARRLLDRPLFEFKDVNPDAANEQIRLISSDIYTAGPDGISRFGFC